MKMNFFSRLFGSSKSEKENSDLTESDIFNEIKNELGERGINLDDAEPFEDNEKMMWIAVPGHEICDDCLDRAGQIKTIAEWEQLGLPGDGKTKCGADCYCILEPEEDAKLSPSIIWEKNEKANNS